MISLIWTAIILVIVYFRYFYMRRIQQFSDKFKSPPYFPLIGTAYKVLTKDQLKALKALHKEMGERFSFWLGWNYNYVTQDPDEIKIILNHPGLLEKSFIYSFFKPFFGNSIVNAPVPVWKKNRKILMKNFSQPILNTFVPIFNKKTVILKQVLEKQRNQYDLFEIFTRYTFDTFSESTLGIDLKIQENVENYFLDAFIRIENMVIERSVNPLFHPDIIYYNLPAGRKFKKEIEMLHNYTLEIINKKREMMEASTKEEDSERKPKSLLDLMLQTKEDGEKVSDDQIKDEVILFITAATESSAFTVAFALTMLGMYPKIQEKVYNEIMEEIGSERPIEPSDLPNLQYTEQVLKEAMRLFPVIPLIGRRATEDVSLGNDAIPKGANVFIFPFFVHRNEKYWSDPLAFDPERFLQENMKSRPVHTFIPFSSGPRNCIGSKYGLMVTKVLLASVVRHFKITSNYKKVEDIKLISNMVLRSEGDLDCQFHPRN